MLVHWFGVPTRLGGKSSTADPIELAALFAALDLAGKTPNARQASALSAKLNAARPRWAEAAVAHMRALREDRKKTFDTELRAHMRRLSQWEQRSLAR